MSTEPIPSDEHKTSSEKSFYRANPTDVESEIEEKSIGVEKAELLAATWKHSFWPKVILGFSAFLCGYAYGLDSQTRYVYQAYATSSWLEHSLLTTVNAITGVVAAASQPVYARLSDVFGRLELFIVAVLFYVVGTIIEGQSPTINAYVAGSVLFQVGYSGVIIMVVFIMSDFSSLRWRLFFQLCPAFPFIINTWISGNVTAAVGLRWSWGISMWAFIFPLASLPLVCCLLHMRYLAGKTEEWKVFKQRKTKFQELGVVGFANFLFWRLDIIGLILLCAALGCVLVPITLAGGTSSSWRTGHIIAPVVVGGVLFPVFALWEVYGAKDPILPLYLMKDRGVWAPAVISFLFDFVYAVESNFLYTVLIVAVNESIASATRITSIGSFVSVIVGFLFGLFVVYFRRLKGFAIFGCCMWMLAFGLLYHYRSDLRAHSGIIAAQCVMGFGTGFFTYPVSILAMANADHEHMAVVVSAMYTFYRVGWAVGSAVASAIWNQNLYKRLLRHLGDATLATSVYGDPYTFIADYAWGTPERDAVVNAYGDVQRILMTVCLCFVAPMIVAGFLMRDPKLTNEQSLEKGELKAQKDSFDRLWSRLRKNKSEV
ncbi:Siderophore iron transporter ARN1 [Candida viswanathii]|uniref:Siderophore iron transporter ARN1 n=1 Tax=Candida viswanathii TaxID=5486 RepID=A0A367XMU4_9ASCO|nr:Siderophore iron transporter ARN1 [Candida viswanathii]